MKILIIVLLSFVLCGCGCVISNENIENAKMLCENNGGLNYISVSVGVYDVYCKNGAGFTGITGIFKVER